MGRIWIENNYKKIIIEGGRPYLNTLKLRLYVASIALSGTVMPNLSNECVDTGYALVTLPFPNVPVNFATWARAVGVNQTWTFTHSPGDFSCYGVFWTDPSRGEETVMACAATDGMGTPTPFPVTAPGQVFVVPTLFDFERWD